MRYGLVAIAACCALLSACATPITLTRVDGQRLRDNPVLQKQFDVDLAICEGEGAKSDLASGAPLARRAGGYSTVVKGCMAQRGYLEDKAAN